MSRPRRLLSNVFGWAVMILLALIVLGILMASGPASCYPGWIGSCQ